MSQQLLKFCPNCQEYTFCEWICDSEILDEPHFTLQCCTCLHEFEPEKELPKSSAELPPEQEVLFK